MLQTITLLFASAALGFSLGFFFASYALHRHYRPIADKLKLLHHVLYSIYVTIPSDRLALLPDSTILDKIYKQLSELWHPI